MNEQDIWYPQSIAVIGLGKIGLPLAVQCALHGGLQVVGSDINLSVVNAINAGESPVLAEEGLADALRRVVTEGQFTATTDTAQAVRTANVALVIVPVVLTAENAVEFSAMDAATRAVGEGLQPDTLVIFETTLPVGTSRGRLSRILEAASGLRAGTDFSLAFSPERVYSGRIFRDLAAYPKIVGGIDGTSTKRAAQFYTRVLPAEIRTVESAEAAEMVKLIETTYRDVNIALANEFALFAERHNVDIRQAIAAANTQPFSHVHQPGLGVGGHCIPVYPYFLINAWDGFRLPPLARSINDGMAAHGVDLLERTLGTLQGARILLLGLTYRENVKEVYHSSAYALSGELSRRGATVLGHDPLLSNEEQRAFGLEPTLLNPLPDVKAIVLQAHHSMYHKLDWRAFRGLRALLDGRGALSDNDAAVLNAQGIRYLHVGLGSMQHS